MKWRMVYRSGEMVEWRCGYEKTRFLLRLVISDECPRYQVYRVIEDRGLGNTVLEPILPRPTKSASRIESFCDTFALAYPSSHRVQLNRMQKLVKNRRS